MASKLEEFTTELTKANRRAYHDHENLLPSHPVRVKDHPAWFSRVDELSNVQKIQEVTKSYKTDKIREHIYDAVSLLARATDNVSFATLPDNKRTFYLGLSNALKQPEFAQDNITASQVVEVLENNDNFRSLLENLDVDETIKIFIGEENILEQVKSCSLVVTKYERDGFEGYMGLIGPTRMKYPFNKAILEEVKKLFKTQ